MQKWFGSRRVSAVFTTSNGLAQVKSATAAAIDRINLESADLKDRIDWLGLQLASVMGDLEGIYCEREPEDEKSLSILERHFVESLERSKDLERQLNVLQHVEKILNN